MKIDTALMPSTFEAAAAAARQAEELGLDGLWSAETSHDPFFPLVVAARSATIGILRVSCSFLFRM